MKRDHRGYKESRKWYKQAGKRSRIACWVPWTIPTPSVSLGIPKQRRVKLSREQTDLVPWSDSGHGALKSPAWTRWMVIQQCFNIIGQIITLQLMEVDMQTLSNNQLVKITGSSVRE